MQTALMIAFLFVSATAAEKGTVHDAHFMPAMDDSMKTMDRDMAAVSMTGNVDHDFATMMMPHHQGAIDMAKAELTTAKIP